MRVWLAAVVLAGACGPPPPATEPTRLDDVDDLELAPVKPPASEPPATRPPTPSPATRAAPRPRPRRPIYRGRRIDLDVKDAELTHLFRFLATVGGVDIVVAPDVRGRVTLKLRQVPWDQIADVVARAHQLEIERDRGIWLIRKRR